jgi:hypothetical protein
MISGLAPGRLALTAIVGKSTLGKAATGSRLYPTMPATSSAAISSAVATGRRMKGSEIFIAA